MTRYGWFNVVLGIWLILSPFILGFATREATWNNIIVGFLVLMLALSSRREVTPHRGAV